MDSEMDSDGPVIGIDQSEGDSEGGASGPSLVVLVGYKAGPQKQDELREAFEAYVDKKSVESSSCDEERILIDCI
jgi:hypothetical protein